MVKLDIVSGFLGAGKTTWIKKLLAACKAADEKIVLIENEFGEVGIDSEILRVEGFEIYEISQGCICCSLKEDFAQTLKEILQTHPHRIIIEPSGIFILSEIFQLLKDPQISENCYLNSITTVVDGLAFSKQISGYSCFLEDQISHASTLVVSKTQLTTPIELVAIADRLNEINPSAELVVTNWALLSNWDLMLMLDGNGRYALLQRDQLGLRQVLNQEHHDHCKGNGHYNDHDHGHHHHDHKFETLGIRTSKVVTEEALGELLQQMCGSTFGNIVRGKGIINSTDNTLEFNIVDGHYSITPCQAPLAGIASFIGSSLQRDKLLAAFE